VPLPVVPRPPPNRRSSRIAHLPSARALVETYAMYVRLVAILKYKENEDEDRDED
jgi:hypothetical protein